MFGKRLARPPRWKWHGLQTKDLRREWKQKLWNETRGKCLTRLTPTETIFTSLVSGSENVGLHVCFTAMAGQRKPYTITKASMSTLGCEIRISLGIQRPIGD